MSARTLRCFGLQAYGALPVHLTQRRRRLPELAVQTCACRLFANSLPTPSGHNKWSTIKHTKFANDAAKNMTAMKHSRAIVAAAKIGGPDPDSNARLYSAIEAAKKASVTKKTIESALRRAAGLGGNDGKALENVTYEAIGPGGSAIVIEALTDNKARTVTSVRTCLTKQACQLGPALFFFDRKGVIRIVKRTVPDGSEETPAVIEFDVIFEHAIEAGAEDIETLDPDEEAEGPEAELPVYQILVDPVDTAKVAQQMKDSYGYDIKEMGIEYVPKKDSVIELTDPQGETMRKVVGLLNEIDDVQDVYTNAS
ncbi:transcriptional regulator TACO1-like protein [Lipomyces tetrasporus]|uniref:Transcriptional regulator TACO1-like protein n=1 Tax=Lipomyces tetrasporus TaxID=54092 RepID=A0AAD7QXH2_9ASCO|nr:transcriptional regulator TACO1-like protein [Lipomyces tetrasporus]KAJ8102711.1 transcriptional regulator TACO1-like protein [Lipomyces tetrasporus]